MCVCVLIWGSVVWFRLALNSEQSSCFWFPYIEITSLFPTLDNFSLQTKKEDLTLSIPAMQNVFTDCQQAGSSKQTWTEVEVQPGSFSPKPWRKSLTCLVTSSKLSGLAHLFPLLPLSWVPENHPISNKEHCILSISVCCLGVLGRDRGILGSSY